MVCVVLRDRHCKLSLSGGRRRIYIASSLITLSFYFLLVFSFSYNVNYVLDLLADPCGKVNII